MFINKTFIFLSNRLVLIFQNCLAFDDGFQQTVKDLLFVCFHYLSKEKLQFS